MTSFRDRRYVAMNSFIEIEDSDKEAIAFFDKNINWQKVEEPKKSVKVEIESEKIEQPKTKK